MNRTESIVCDKKDVMAMAASKAVEGLSLVHMRDVDSVKVEIEFVEFRTIKATVAENLEIASALLLATGECQRRR